MLLQADENKTAKKGLDMNALGKSLETLLGKGRQEENWNYNSIQTQSLTHPSVLDQQHRYCPLSAVLYCTNMD